VARITRPPGYRRGDWHGLQGIAHKFTPSNDFRDLAALSRNIFRSPSVLFRDLVPGRREAASKNGVVVFWTILRDAMLSIALQDEVTSPAALPPLRFVPRRRPKTAKAKRIFRDAKRNVSHWGP
jgi:hypothetical protein